VALKVVRYRPLAPNALSASQSACVGRVGGVIVPFIGIKRIDVVIGGL